MSEPRTKHRSGNRFAAQNLKERTLEFSSLASRIKSELTNNSGKMILHETTKQKKIRRQIINYKAQDVLPESKQPQRY
jgi:hypothetical protein